jgi:hypothetical protein
MSPNEKMFLLRVGRVADLARRGNAERLEYQIAHPVEEIHERLRDEVEDPHHRRHEQRRPCRARDRQALRRQLAEDHVERRGHQEGDQEGDRQPDDLGALSDQRLQQRLEHRLGERTEAQARDRDPELAGREIGIEVIHGVAHRARARPLLTLEVVDLGGS